MRVLTHRLDHAGENTHANSSAARVRAFSTRGAPLTPFRSLSILRKLPIHTSGTGMAAPLLEIENLKTYFHTEGGRVRAVDGLSVSVAAGRTLGIVGESGSGKSVTSLSVMQLLPPASS